MRSDTERPGAELSLAWHREDQRDSARLVREAWTDGSLHSVLQTTLVEACTAVVGRTTDGAPWGFGFGRDGPSHLVIQGPAGCGKSELLRTCLVSLCWSTDPGALRVLAIDPSGRQLGMIDGLPHALLEPVIDPRRAAALIAWLCDEVRLRRRCRGVSARLALAVEDLTPWKSHRALEARLGWLRRHGGPHGVHVIQAAASSEVEASIAEADTRLACGTGIAGDFIVTSRREQVAIRALWLPVRELVACLDEIRQNAWLSGAAQPQARGGLR